MSPVITGVVEGIRISRLKNAQVTVRCKDCGVVFTTTTNENGCVKHLCPSKPKKFFCSFQVGDDDLVSEDK